MTDKIILTDCDGVLLDWEAAFRPWVTRQGYCYQKNASLHWSVSKKLGIDEAEATTIIEKFNSSADFENLPPLRDSVAVVQRLHSQGWKFIIITSAGTHPWTRPLRQTNLDAVFGKDFFDQLFILPVTEDKGKILKDYTGQNLYWIEDHVDNAVLGYDYGLRPILVNHPSNSHYHGPILRVGKWAEIETIVNSQQWPASNTVVDQPSW